MKHIASLLVALRVRPMNHAEFKNGAKLIAHTVDNNLVVLLDPGIDPDDILRANRSREKHYVFDHAFDQMATQNDVYEATMKNLVGDVLSGFNVTVFAYGPTGAGKTYTMLGTHANPGIMVLTLNDLFYQMKSTEDDIIYNVTMSYMEIYNEMIRDLLDPSRGILELREDTNGDTVVAGLSEIEATSPLQVMELLDKGNLCRTCEPTAANRTSSRSHAILKVIIRSRSRVMDVTQDVHIGSLFMVDLAGSERAAVTKNRGKRMVEGAHINRSLLALGNVINALAAGQGKVPYVNFRDSKLTRILKESLGGNSKTVMISHISPASSSYEESRNTLTYAERSKSIKTKVQQNILEAHYHVLQYHDIIAQLKNNISILQNKLDCCQCSTKEDLEVFNGLCHKLIAVFSEQKELREAICALKYSLVQNVMDTQKPLSVISEWKLRDLPIITTVPSTTHVPVDDDIQQIKLTSPKDTPNETVLSDDVPIMDILDPTLDTSTITTDTPTHKICSEEQKDTTLCESVLSINQIAYSTTENTKEMEPPEVSQAREELAMLVGWKQRMEARQRRLERLLADSDTHLSELLENLSKLTKVPLHCQQYLQHITTQHELQSSALECELRATLGSLKLTYQEKTMDELKKHSSLSMELVDKQMTLLKEHGVSIPESLLHQLQQLKITHSLLAAQVETHRHIVSKTVSEHPVIARYSAHTDFSLAQGSKSNLLKDEDDDEEEIRHDHQSDLQLPKLALGPLVRTGWTSTATLPLVMENKHPPLLLPVEMSTNTTTEALSLPVLFSPTATDSSSHTVSKSKSLPRSFNSLPVLGISDTRKPHRPLLNKMISFNTPAISISRCSSDRRQKYMVEPTKNKDHTLDIESVKTTSVTSISTTKSKSQIHSKKTAPPRQQPVITKTRRSTFPVVNPIPKLSQTTRNKLKETRTSLTANESLINTRKPTQFSQTSLAKKPQKKTLHNNSSPRRQPYLPVVQHRPKPLQTKPVLVPHKVTASGVILSPYLKTPIKSKNTKTSHKPSLQTKHK